MGDRIFQSLVRRVRAAEDGDHRLVLDPGALAEVAALRRQSLQEHGHLPHNELRVIAWTHWRRYMALEDGEDQDDFRAACELFESIMDETPDELPYDLYDHLAGQRRWRRFEEARALIEQAGATRSPAVASEAAAMIDGLLADTPASDENRPNYPAPR